MSNILFKLQTPDGCQGISIIQHFRDGRIESPIYCFDAVEPQILRFVVWPPEIFPNGSSPVHDETTDVQQPINKEEVI